MLRLYCVQQHLLLYAVNCRYTRGRVQQRDSFNGWNRDWSVVIPRQCQWRPWRYQGRQQLVMLLPTICCFKKFLTLSHQPRVGPGIPPLSHHFRTFFSLLVYFFPFSYSCFIYLLAFHPSPFYQNSPTLFPRPDVVGGDKTWLQFYLC